MTQKTHQPDDAEQDETPQGFFGRLMSKLAPGDTQEGTMVAVWRDIEIAASDNTVVVEGNHYFPAESVRMELLRQSDHHSVCPWKGMASYYDVVVNGDTNRNAAWYYPDPSPAAQHIAGRIAFWGGVKVRRAERTSPEG